MRGRSMFTYLEDRRKGALHHGQDFRLAMFWLNMRRKIAFRETENTTGRFLQLHFPVTSRLFHTGPKAPLMSREADT